MRRDTFLKSLAALAATGALPLPAWAAPTIKMMIPANPGGGWDTTGRALGKALQDGKLVDAVQYDNKGGAAGALGLAQFVNSAKGDPNAMMVMGAVMLGGIITGRPPVNLTQATPIARLTSDAASLRIELQTPDAEGATALRGVIERHVDRFAFREAPLSYAWEPLL